MDPYRANLDALRAQSSELDRALVERRAELRRLKAARRLAQWKWVVPSLALLALSGWLWREKHARHAEKERATVRYGARVTRSNRHGLTPGTRCLVEISPDCYAKVSCASFGYSAWGRCDAGHFVAYGNPSCTIDGDHIEIQSVTRSLNPQHAPDTIATELVRE